MFHIPSQKTESPCVCLCVCVEMGPTEVFHEAVYRAMCLIFDTTASTDLLFQSD